MSSTRNASETSSSNFEALFNEALAKYTQKTGDNLRGHPLASKIDSCKSAESFLAIFQEQVQEFEEFRKGDSNLIEWLRPVVDGLLVLSNSGAVQTAAELVFPPAKYVFSAISVLLSAAKNANYDSLVDIFECIENFLRRLMIYTETGPTPALTTVVVNIMVELLSVFALATVQIRQGRFKKWKERVLGENKIEPVLQRLDRLTQQESQMTAAQMTVAQTETLDVVRGLVDNMRVVMEDGKTSTDGIRQALVKIQKMEVEIQEMRHSQLRRDLRDWLSASDPSIKHNNVQKLHYRGTAKWFTGGKIFGQWKLTGSLLWIHGLPGAGKTIMCSTIIEDIQDECQIGLAILTFYYFDFRHIDKQDARSFLSSLLMQLGDQSDKFSQILSALHSSHRHGSRQPSEDDLLQCLKNMLEIPGQGELYIVVDALDECQNLTGFRTPRQRVLDIIKELVDLKASHLHLCVTSRFEMDIRWVLGPLRPVSVPLHEERGQKEDIAQYIKEFVESDARMQMWPERERKIVIRTLSEKGCSTFLWAQCQLETLRCCPVQRISHTLQDLPKDLNETYERILHNLPEQQWKFVHRIFQCLVLSIRPPRVEEVAEILVVRPDVVLSAYSTLLAVIDIGGKQVVQFKHLSVMEYLTSDSIANSEYVSNFHIPRIPAHTLLTGICFSTALQIDDQFDGTKLKNFPEAKHWVDHAQSEDVSSYIEDAMECFFDTDKPYFAAWTWLCDIEEPPSWSTAHRKVPDATPLYYAALCGFRNIAERLIEKYPQDVNARGGRYVTAIHAAVDKRQLNTTRLLLDRGADVDSQGIYHYTPLHLSSHYGYADMVQLLIDRGADPNAKNVGQETPLIMASNNGRLEAARLLLERGADANQPNNSGWTPLHIVSLNGYEDIVNLLLYHGANINIENDIRDTPLHIASFHGQFTIMKLLLERGADVGARDTQGGTPLHDAAQSGLPYAVQLLLDHGGDVDTKNEDGRTALHMAAYHGLSEVGNLLLTRGADVNAQDGDGWTALHLAAYRGHIGVGKLLFTRGGRWYTQNNEGNTPLQVALEGDDSEIAQLLSKRYW